MAKKKTSATGKKKAFSRDPFNELKGFAVSNSGEPAVKKPLPRQKEPSDPESFKDAMEQLGVKRMNSVDDEAADELLESRQLPGESPKGDAPQSDAELFLDAMDELQVRFSENFAAAEESQTASARRMKQLKQGRLVPEASLDLHGLQRTEVADKLRFFLQDALYQGWRTVLVITGKGLHSEGGEPVLRSETERFLNSAGKHWAAEWGRAPKRYGGAGALVLFLRKRD